MEKEIRRQVIHIFLGMLALALLFLIGRFKLMVLGFGALIIGSVFINRRLCGNKDPVSNTLMTLFERENAPVPFWGFAWYATGILILLVFLNSTEEIATGIFLLGAGDGFSTLVGMNGKIKNPLNSKKTIEGSVAFAAMGMLTYIWVGWIALPLAIITALVESLPLGFDDNATIPITVVLFFMVI